jgi:trk system potassium uptake protein TrkA
MLGKMKKQCLIIGLGMYGMTVAKNLSDVGVEVMAIDKNMKIVEQASEFVEKAICLDITALDALNHLPLSEFDYAVVGIGEDISANVLACLALKDAKIKHITAKAGNHMHKRILERLEIDDIVFPEEDIGIITAQKLFEKPTIQKK